MRGETYCEVANKSWATVKSLCSMLGRPSLQEGRTGNGVSIVKSLLSRQHILWSVNKLARGVTNWDLAIDVLHSSKNLPLLGDPVARRYPKEKHTDTRTKKHINRDDVELFNVDYCTTNAKPSHFGAWLHMFEDTEAAIKMIIKNRSPTMRHVSRTHRDALDWLFDGINLDPKIQITYVDTKNQLADMLTNVHFTRDEWNLFSVCS